MNFLLYRIASFQLLQPILLVLLHSAVDLVTYNHVRVNHCFLHAAVLSQQKAHSAVTGYEVLDDCGLRLRLTNYTVVTVFVDVITLDF